MGDDATAAETTRVVAPAAVSGTKRWLTEGVVLALVPVIAYLVAYTYEWSYTHYFGVPAGLINVNLTTLFLAGVAVLLGLVPILVAALAVSDVGKGSRGIITRRLNRVTTHLFIGIALLIASRGFALVAATIVVARLVELFVWPVIRHWR